MSPPEEATSRRPRLFKGYLPFLLPLSEHLAAAAVLTSDLFEYGLNELTGLVHIMRQIVHRPRSFEDFARDVELYLRLREAITAGSTYESLNSSSIIKVS